MIVGIAATNNVIFMKCDEHAYRRWDDKTLYLKKVKCSGVHENIHLLSLQEHRIGHLSYKVL